MSGFEKLKSLSNKPVKTENVAFTVESYDTEAKTVSGKRLDNGEAITVSLRNIDHNGKNPRPEIADFAGESTAQRKVRTEVGGILRADGAIKNGEGEYQARWLSVISHDSSEGAAIVAPAIVFPAFKGSNNRTYRQVGVLNPDEVQEITSREGFDQAVKALINDASSKDNYVLIRAYAFDADKKQLHSQSQTFSIPKDTEDTAEARQAAILENPRYNKFANTMAEAAGESDVRIEALRGRKLWVGADSNTETFGRMVKADGAEVPWFLRTGKTRSDEVYEYGMYAQATVGVLRHKDPDGNLTDAAFVTSITPTAGKPVFDRAGLVDKAAATARVTHAESAVPEDDDIPDVPMEELADASASNPSPTPS